MSTWRRMGVLIMVTIGVAISALMYYEIFMAELYDMAVNEYAGPFSQAAELMVWFIPTVLAIILLGTAVWAIGGGVQEERARMRRGLR